MIHPWHDVPPGRKLRRLVGVTVEILLELILPAAAQTSKADDAELRNIMNVYAEAVNKADANLGSQLWCGSEEDSITNPGHWQGSRAD